MTYLAICLLGIFLYLALGIVPNQRTLRELDETLAETKARIEEREMLISVRQALKQRTQKQGNSLQGARTLPLPSKNEHVSIEVDKLNATMKDIARQAKVELVSLTPGLGSLEGNSKVLAVELVVRGAFPAFRRFLIALGGLPYLEHVEELQCQQNSEGLELRVKLLVERA